jgi:hypothetical protein
MTSSGLIESIGAATMMCTVLLILGSPLIYAGWKNRKRFRELSSINSNFNNSTVGDYIIISGDIKSSTGIISSPFQSNNCCLAMWDISSLKRRGTLGAGFVWSQEALGIKSKDLVISTDSGDVKVKKLSNQKVLDSSEKIKRSLMADSTSKFSSIEIELDYECFEDKVKPIEESPTNYKDFTDELDFKRSVKDQYGIIGKVLSKLRTPSGTTRYREKVFQKGDSISIIGCRTKDGVAFVESDSISPLVSSKPVSKILRKYRLSYLFQMYFIPIFCVCFSAFLGYGAYL